MPVTDIWKDHRSKPAGCFAGNKVLAALKPRLGELKHQKGTVFTLEQKGRRRKIYIGRICSTGSYLATARDEKHFANVSRSQLDAWKEATGYAYYLFITITDRKIDYWVIPLSVIERIIEDLPEKNDGSSFIRIYEEERRYYIEETDVTRYHDKVKISTTEFRKYCRPRKSA